MIGRLAFWRRDGAASSSEDCLACRLVSGIGLLGIGTYLLAHSKKRPKPLENYTMKGLAAAVGILGVARLADASFLKATVEEPKEEQTKSVKAAKDHEFFARR